MAVEIKTLEELTTGYLNDIATLLGVDITELGNTFQVDSRAVAGIAYPLYLLLAQVHNNIYPDLAEEDVLTRYGEIILERKPAPSESGEYSVQVTGEIGATIDASTQFKANDDTEAAGYLFILDNSYTLTSETDTITLRALTPGTDARLFVDDILTSTRPIVNVDSEVSVLAVTKEPVAAEDIESYREDVIAGLQLLPQGGSPTDYRLWASDEPTVRRVYTYLKPGYPNNLDVYVEATAENTAPAEITGVPTQDTLDAVYKAPDETNPESGVLVINPENTRGRRPVGIHSIFSLPVQPLPVDLDFINLSDESIKDSIRTSIDALLYEIRPFVAGAQSISSKNDILTIGKIIASVIEVLSGTGITYENLTMTVDDLLVNTYTFRFGYIPYLRLIINDGAPI